jgi:peptidoglycan-associated lipoprotein
MGIYHSRHDKETFLMKYHGILHYGIILTLASIILWGCPKRSEVTASPDTQKEQMAPLTAPALAETGKDQKSALNTSTMGPSEEEKERATAAKGSLKPIYFDFDKAFVRDDAKSIINMNTEWLKSHPKAMIKIEGNCDEQGTVEYNQALGQRRAVSAKKYLTEMGVASSRISLISFGKEKPVCTESAESCWQRNRRDDFVVVSQ